MDVQQGSPAASGRPGHGGGGGGGGGWRKGWGYHRRQKHLKPYMRHITVHTLTGTYSIYTLTQHTHTHILPTHLHSLPELLDMLCSGLLHVRNEVHHLP